jgi:hypothetical protein
VPEIKIDPESNIIELGAIGLEALTDRIIILQDEYRSGYECQRCMERDVRNNVSMVKCDNCFNGTTSTGKKCTPCNGLAVVPCPECGGKGGLLASSDQDKDKRPTTGTVCSIGESVTRINLGERVMFPSYIGHSFDLAAIDIHGNTVTAVVTMCRYEDLLCKLHGVLALKDIHRSKALGTLA